MIIQKEQLSILFNNQLSSQFISILAAIAVSAFSFIHHSGLESFVWLMLLLLVSAIRLQLTQKSNYEKSLDSLQREEQAREIHKLYRNFNVAVFASGAVWGAAPLLILGEGSVFEQIIFIYVLGALSVGALASYSSSTLSFLCFTVPVILLATFKFALLGEGLILFPVFMGLIYLGLLTLTSIRLERYIINGIELKHATQKLSEIERNQRDELDENAAILRDHKLSLDVAKVWTWRTDPDLVLSDISAIFQNTTGFKAGDLIGRSIKDFIKLLQPEDNSESDLVSKMGLKQAVNDFELDLVRLDGTGMTLSINAIPHFDSDQRFTGYRGVGRDITPVKNSIRKLEKHAARDSLTELFNRRAFHEKVEALTCKRKGGFEQFYIAYVDLDRLKIVNDSAGHICGDQLLQELSKKLLQEVDTSVDLARIGGDEFALILHNPSLDKAISTVEKIIDTVRHYRYMQNDSSFSIGVNVGLVPVLSGDTTVTELVRYADHACSVSREKGDYGYYVASAICDTSENHDKGTRSVQKMFDALDKGRLAINYQPIASAVDGKIHFFEALLNMKDTAGTASSAGAHISIVEKYGVMAHFDRWVIRDVFRGFSLFQQQHPGASVFVNLSGSNLDDENLFAYIREQIAKYSVPRDKICFEITETAAIRNTQDAIQLIKGLKSSGCRFALDDFGTGLASLSYLKDFPVDFVKLDGTFIHNLKNDPVDQAILKAVAELGESLGFSIIAESVEDADLIPYLKEAGVSFVQGYSIGYPEPLRD